ncbi:hypothetical protein LTR05_005974 [Lithohypha guttulata]|uniref:Uncharacterized protein n=1 Tax=Lithohypha guttulata TaxID=1690604 RepID=A0AAN7SXI9_9EURO|nr:hypothetical protein LTR05_005974 [Lithohypha guttulata]
MLHSNGGSGLGENAVPVHSEGRLRWTHEIPDIDCNEIPILPDTIVYAESSDGDVYDAATFAKHRAEREWKTRQNANAYLRGENLCISTAELRGPFNNGWQNPWAAGPRDRKDDRAERAQTVLTSDFGDETPWRRKSRLRSQLNDLAQRRKEKSRDHHFALLAKTPITKQMTPDEKIDSWLRKGHAYSQPSDEENLVEPGSPTPGRSRRLFSTRDRTPIEQLINVNSQHARAPLRLPDNEATDSFETAVAIPHEPEKTHLRLQSALAIEPPTKKRLRADMVGTDRAEAAIKRYRITASNIHESTTTSTTPVRHDLQPVKKPSPSRQSLHQTAGVAKEPEIKSEMLEVAIDEQRKSLSTSEQPHLSYDSTDFYFSSRSAEASALTTTSESNPTNLIPSAQPTSDLQASILPSEPLLPDRPTSTRDTVVEHVLEASAPGSAFKIKSNINHEPVREMQNGQMQRSTEEMRLEKDGITSIDKLLSPQPLETQTLAHDAGTAVCPPGPTVNSSLPMSSKRKATKPAGVPPSKKRKSATSAAEAESFSSTGSIKSVLRVRKAADQPPDYVTFPRLSFQKPGLDMETSIDEPSTIIPTAKARNLKSILKPKHVFSSHPTPPYAAASSRPSRQDTMVSGQGALVYNREDRFDLDSAMDELGSFLSSWDAEKSALHI